jgi:hypothetical protein
MRALETTGGKVLMAYIRGDNNQLRLPQPLLLKQYSEINDKDISVFADRIPLDAVRLD